MTTTTAPILRQRLQLALLNRHQKQKSLLQKGFTLVELMIVIVIVGILSAVALPNFLSQTDKAKLTEAQTAAATYLKQYYAASLESTDEADAVETACVTDTSNWDYTCVDNEFQATSKFGTATTYKASVDLTTGEITKLAKS